MHEAAVYEEPVYEATVYEEPVYEAHEASDIFEGMSELEISFPIRETTVLNKLNFSQLSNDFPFYVSLMTFSNAYLSAGLCFNQLLFPTSAQQVLK